MAGTNLTHSREKLDVLLKEHQYTNRRITEAKKESLQTRKNIKVALEAQKVIQEISQAIQQNTHNQITSVVTKCLATVFGANAYSFRIDFEQKRGKTEAKLVLSRDGQDFDPQDVGGGVLDIVSFALRLAAVILSRPPVRRILILDEPFRNLRGLEYRARVRELIVQLADELGIQFILNIDLDSYPEFELGKVVEIKRGKDTR